MDADSEEAADFRGFLVRKLVEWGVHAPATTRVEIASHFMATWWGEYSGERRAPQIATAKIKGMGIKELKHVRITNSLRGWAWTGESAPPKDPARPPRFLA